MLSFNQYATLSGRDGLRKFLRFHQHKQYPKAALHFRDVADLQERGHLLLGAQNYKGELYGAAILLFPRLGTPNNTQLHHHFARGALCTPRFRGGPSSSTDRNGLCRSERAQLSNRCAFLMNPQPDSRFYWSTGTNKKVLERKVYAEPNRKRRVGQILTA